MKIFHLSSECYPAAKVGGLADVVGTLPRYLNSDTKSGMPDGEGETANGKQQVTDGKRQIENARVEASVIIPKYATSWIKNREFSTEFTGKTLLGEEIFKFNIQKISGSDLGFSLYLVDIPEQFDRPGIYGHIHSGTPYEDEADRWFSFQIAALEWIKKLPKKPDIIHCHDHHTALIPFMMTQCHKFEALNSIPTVLTVHNAEYQGIYSHKKQVLLPTFNEEKVGLLDWDGQLNSLAAGLKCCWQITTVSPSYMQELREQSSGLESLFENEKQKSLGILNGIDTQTWDPETDSFLSHNYTIDTVSDGKNANKIRLCDQFDFDVDYPLISFIGRFAAEKGADLLPDLFTFMLENQKAVNFLILGSGEPNLHKRFQEMSNKYIGYFDASLSYNESLAHQIYAGTDFLLIPSRVEPCGLNQMYAMRYGTIPVVRRTGGLKDTVTDIAHPRGNGITFSDFSVEAAAKALNRAIGLYKNKVNFYTLQNDIMKQDFSWNRLAERYVEMYERLISE